MTCIYWWDSKSRIDLFVSSDTCKGKAAYTRISPDLAKAGSYRVLLLLLYSKGSITSLPTAYKDFNDSPHWNPQWKNDDII